MVKSRNVLKEGLFSIVIFPHTDQGENKKYFSGYVKSKGVSHKMFFREQFNKDGYRYYKGKVERKKEEND
jgi:hypothetical protein